MSIKTFFANNCETRELHREPELRTNYYGNNFSQIVAALNEIASEMRLEVRNVDKTHREVYMLGQGYDVIFTLVEITPIEIGVDIKVNWFSALGFNRPKKKIMEIYSKMKKKLRFKGVALHP